jgi:hypothetical protein
MDSLLSPNIFDVLDNWDEYFSYINNIFDYYEFRKFFIERGDIVVVYFEIF